jgi:DNA modification methylase
MKIENKPLISLIPYEFNNRNHSEEQINLIANSIKEFGFNQPIVIDESNIILVGHGRLLAAQKLGLKEAPTVQLKGLSETQKKAYRILDNKLQNDSTWSFDNLELELGFLEDNDFDLEAWGLDDLRDLFPEPELEASEDDFEPTEQLDMYIKRGDLIELGKHRVLCGDSTSADELNDLLQGKKAHAVITDPPYNVGLEYADNETDEKTDDIYRDFTEKWLSLTATMSDRQIVTPGCNNLESWCKWFEPKHIAPWIKTNACTHGRVTQWWAWEPILFFGEGLKSKRANDVFDFPIGAQRDTGGHPCPKPLKLWGELITFWTEAKDLIYEPFSGSGTTLIACEQLERICYGMEISPQYCQVIIDRYKAYCDKNNKKFICKINGVPFMHSIKGTDGGQTEASEDRCAE